MKRSIDLNCDLGEGSGNDAAIIPYVTSINIACGFHAGDPATMHKTVQLALSQDVSIALGAHPSFPDRENFGRLVMPMTPQEVYDLVLYQAGALNGISLAVAATAVSHIKPHGALYNLAAKDLKYAQAIAVATRDFDPECTLVGLAGSKLLEAGKNAGISVASEAFADRAYEADGSLTPRDQPHALVDDPAVAAERALKIVLQGMVTSRQGTEVPLHADTICIHSDSPGAVEMAQAVREHLERAGIEVKRFSKYS